MNCFRLIVLAMTVALLRLPHSQATEPVDFQNDLQPVLTKFGCNSGPCHGKARGQGGFQLSLLGFDSAADYDAIVKEGRGRRIFPGDPAQSLLIRKPTALEPHGGGRRFDVDSPEYSLLLQWIEQGAPRRVEGAPQLVRISVSPTSAVMSSGETLPLAVTAEYDNGSTRDVTRLTSFQSNEATVAAVDEAGLTTAGTVTGEAAVMARFMDQLAVCTVTVPLTEPVAESVYEQLPRKNFIDGHVWQKLQALRITPSPVCDDHTFLRRVTTDISGRIPTPEEVTEFLDDPSPDKRVQVVDRLIQEPDFADHWANKWVDLLRPNPYRVGIKAVLNYDHWIRQSFHERKPWDQFVRELITAQGSTFRNGAVTMFRDRRTPDELATLVSQLFIGVRLECAKCHHHPFEVWGQDDFYSFAAYFAKLDQKGRGVSPPISGSEEFFFAGSKGSVKHPLTNEEMTPRPLFGQAPDVAATADPRQALAAWITSPENPLFEQVMANRIWADLMGRGLVDPVDDLRATNPPSNAELLEDLGREFRESGYSISHLIKTIASSHAYQLSSLPNDRNIADTRNYSRHYRHRLRAEVLLDAFAQVSGQPHSFEAMPPDSTAKQLWTHRTDSLFLDTFGRPDPNQDPPCERTTDSTVVQSLHLMNSEQLHKQITSDDGSAARLAESDKTPSELVVHLYRLIYSRNPTQEELTLCVGLFQVENASRRQVVEDLMWALLNTPEFVIQN